MIESIPFFPIRRLNKSELESTLPQPQRHPDIPENAQWLSGEGAGSWFVLEFQKYLLKVTRFAFDGTVECSGLYEETNGYNIDPHDSFRVDYPSNCKEVILKNSDANILFERTIV